MSDGERDANLELVDYAGIVGILHQRMSGISLIYGEAAGNAGFAEIRSTERTVIIVRSPVVLINRHREAEGGEVRRLLLEVVASEANDALSITRISS